MCHLKRSRKSVWTFKLDSFHVMRIFKKKIGWTCGLINCLSCPNLLMFVDKYETQSEPLNSKYTSVKDMYIAYQLLLLRHCICRPTITLRLFHKSFFLFFKCEQHFFILEKHVFCDVADKRYCLVSLALGKFRMSSFVKH